MSSHMKREHLLPDVRTRQRSLCRGVLLNTPRTLFHRTALKRGLLPGVWCSRMPRIPADGGVGQQPDAVTQPADVGGKKLRSSSCRDLQQGIVGEVEAR